MLIHKDQLQQMLLFIVAQRIEQGCDLDSRDFSRRIESAADSYDALVEIAVELRSPPLREDWPYDEPLAWADIVAQSAHLKPEGAWPEPNLDHAAENVRWAFLSSVCGCMLGKPIEVDPSLAELQRAGEAVGEWPIDDYISQAFLHKLGRRHESSQQTTRENIRCVAADDDIHYTLIGMLLIENKGLRFGHSDIYNQWLMNMPPLWTWGAERTTALTSAINAHHLLPKKRIEDCHDVLFLNPGDDLCGALIRADAYGYACPGNPDLAAWLAWKDASFSHIKTGVYGAMFVAALIALCHSANPALKGNDRLAIIEQALLRIPAKTRFSAIVRDALEKVSAAKDWLAAYQTIHGKYREYTHCRIYQEIGTLINTLKFATSIDHGFCIQVSQGNDTDSFGATAGSMLGCFFGPGHLHERWLQPFQNKINHALGDLHEYDLNVLADRISGLPTKVYAEFQRDGISL
ncbi:MAG: ADP-ribosylglycohydrolase [Halioglobus sp.]|jgi:ADP-ribosylglycohydrolase